MGVETQYIESKPSHYRHFGCSVCQRLVDLDCVVTASCSHLACRECMEKHLSTANSCPTCKKDFSRTLSNVVQPLKLCQPVAYRVLQDVQVCCTLPGSQCKWHGRYADLNRHTLDKAAHAGSTSSKHSRGAVTSARGKHTRSGQKMNMTVDDVTEVTESSDVSHSSTDSSKSLWENEPRPSSSSSGINRNTTARSPQQLCAHFKEEGNSHFSNQRYSQARAMYTRGLNLLAEQRSRPAVDSHELNNFEAMLLSNRAACHLAEKNYTEAIKDAQAALVRQPVYEKASLRLARAYFAMGNFASAVDACQKACQQGHPTGAMQDVLKQCKTMQQAHENALLFFDNGQYEKASTNVEILLPVCPVPSILLLAAQIDLGMGNTEKANKICEQILKENPRSTKAQLLQGKAAILAGQETEGSNYIKQALRENPDSTAAKQTAKKWLPVAESLQKAQETLKQGKWEDCVHATSNALKICPLLPPNTPLFATLHAQRARAYVGLGKHAQALADCETVLQKKQHSEHADTWLARLSALYELGRFGEASEDVLRIQETWGRQDSRFAKERCRIQGALHMRPDFYGLLGVSPKASEKELRKAFRRKSSRCHPDRFVNASDDKRNEAADEFQKLNEAIEILSDEFMRKLYDQGQDVKSIRQQAFLNQCRANKSAAK